jgi:hypothetical protein
MVQFLSTDKHFVGVGVEIEQPIPTPGKRIPEFLSVLEAPNCRNQPRDSQE